MTVDGDRQLEDGTVLEVLPGAPVHARVLLAAGPGCEECGARLFCRPEDPERRSLLARVSGPAPRPGQHVRVAVSGSRVLAAGLWAYGFPLLGLCCGLSLGWIAFAGYPGRELFAGLLGLAGGAVPFWLLWRQSRSRPTEEWFDACLVADPPPSELR